MNDDETQDKHYLAFGDGMPTGPDVEMIIRAYPDLALGSRIERDAIYKLLGLDADTRRGANRLRSVMVAFERKMRRDRGLVIDYDGDAKSFRVSTPADVLAQTPKELEKIKRRARKASRKLGMVAPYATEAERPVVEHHSRVLQVVVRETKKQQLNLLPSTRVAETPRIGPPTDGAQKTA